MRKSLLMYWMMLCSIREVSVFMCVLVVYMYGTDMGSDIFQSY